MEDDVKQALQTMHDSVTFLQDTNVALRSLNEQLQNQVKALEGNTTSTSDNIAAIVARVVVLELTHDAESRLDALEYSASMHDNIIGKYHSDDMLAYKQDFAQPIPNE